MTLRTTQQNKNTMKETLIHQVIRYNSILNTREVMAAFNDRTEAGKYLEYLYHNEPIDPDSHLELMSPGMKDAWNFDLYKIRELHGRNAGRWVVTNNDETVCYSAPSDKTFAKAFLRHAVMLDKLDPKGAPHLKPWIEPIPNIINPKQGE